MCAVVDIAEAVASLFIASYCTNAVDVEMDNRAQYMSLAHEVKYYHEGVTKGQFLDAVRRNIERMKQACPMVAIHMEDAEIIDFISSLDEIYEGV